MVALLWDDVSKCHQVGFFFSPKTDLFISFWFIFKFLLLVKFKGVAFFLKKIIKRMKKVDLLEEMYHHPRVRVQLQLIPYSDMCPDVNEIAYHFLPFPFALPLKWIKETNVFRMKLSHRKNQKIIILFIFSYSYSILST